MYEHKMVLILKIILAKYMKNTYIILCEKKYY